MAVRAVGTGPVFGSEVLIDVSGMSMMTSRRQRQGVNARDFD